MSKRNKLDKLNLAVTAAIMLAGSGLPAWAQGVPDLRPSLTADAGCGTAGQGGGFQCDRADNFPSGSQS